MRPALLLILLLLPACASNQGGKRPSYSRDTAAAAINDTLDARGTLRGRGDSARDSAHP